MAKARKGKRHIKVRRIAPDDPLYAAGMRSRFTLSEEDSAEILERYPEFADVLESGGFVEAVPIGTRADGASGFRLVPRPAGHKAKSIH